MSRAAAPDAALAAALRRLREERHVSREALALRAGLATGTLARIELARAAPGWDTVRRLAGALGVSLVDVALAVEDGQGQEGPATPRERFGQPCAERGQDRQATPRERFGQPCAERAQDRQATPRERFEQPCADTVPRR